MCRNVNVCASVYSVAKQMRWAFGDTTHAFGLAPVARPCCCCHRPHRSDPRPCPRPHRFISSSRSRGFNAERPCRPRLRSRPRRPRPRLGPVWSRRCCLLLSALPLTAQPGHCRSPALPLSSSALPLARPRPFAGKFGHAPSYTWVHSYRHPSIYTHIHIYMYTYAGTGIYEYM